ncbi:MAG TPA: cell division protein SepF [Syntrophomonas sp.]|nr:cell division protein SepF [Syntrophomonas sp.]HCF70274.1 cell division protein SepF [Syntrophomonas sp.]
MGFMDNVWTWFGVQSEVKEEIVELPESSSVDNKRTLANVVSISTNKNFKVVVCEPETFDEVQVLADHLKNRKQIILNFEHTAPEVSQKIIDFISGTTYALEGNSQQLGNNMFIFTPSNVEISKDHRMLMRKTGMVSKPLGGEK